jgi:hypothetical protein
MTGSPPEVKVAFYCALFAARTDVYATRYENPRTGKGGWVPAVRGGWRKGMRPVCSVAGQYRTPNRQGTSTETSDLNSDYAVGPCQTRRDALGLT